MQQETERKRIATTDTMDKRTNNFKYVVFIVSVFAVCFLKYFKLLDTGVAVIISTIVTSVFGSKIIDKLNK